jgi:hypothetical protein
MQPIDSLLRQIADLFLLAILFAIVLVIVFSKQTMMIRLLLPASDRQQRSPSLNSSDRRHFNIFSAQLATATYCAIL